MDINTQELMSLDALITQAINESMQLDSDDVDNTSAIVNRVLSTLNPEQHQVATDLNGFMQVIACAGSGKTHALTARLSNMLAQGINPSTILMFTFTNNAADEMRNRAARISPVASLITACTFHSLCFNVIASCDPQATIKDSSEVVTLISYIKGLHPEVVVKGMPSANVIAGVMSYMFNRECDLHTALTSRKAWEKYNTPEYICAITKIIELFDAYMRQGHYYSYDDILKFGLQ